jgi:hypothetical protein
MLQRSTPRINDINRKLLWRHRLPLKLACCLVEDVLLPAGSENTVFERALPLSLVSRLT